jgi:predicted RecB family endonuclease
LEKSTRSDAIARREKEEKERKEKWRAMQRSCGCHTNDLRKTCATDLYRSQRGEIKQQRFGDYVVEWNADNNGSAIMSLICIDCNAEETRTHFTPFPSSPSFLRQMAGYPKTWAELEAAAKLRKKAALTQAECVDKAAHKYIEDAGVDNLGLLWDKLHYVTAPGGIYRHYLPAMTDYHLTVLAQRNGKTKEEMEALHQQASDASKAEDAADAAEKAKQASELRARIEKDVALEQPNLKWASDVMSTVVEKIKARAALVFEEEIASVASNAEQVSFLRTHLKPEVSFATEIAYEYDFAVSQRVMLCNLRSHRVDTIRNTYEHLADLLCEAPKPKRARVTAVA